MTTAAFDKQQHDKVVSGLVIRMISGRIWHGPTMTRERAEKELDQVCANGVEWWQVNPDVRVRVDQIESVEFRYPGL